MSGGIGIVVLGLYERFSGRNVPLWLYIAVLVSFALLACYLTWRDSQIELLKVGTKEARGRDFLIGRLEQFIAGYNQIDEGVLTISFENSGKLIRRDAYYKQVRGFLAQHFDNAAVEDFNKRRVVFLEELLGKLVNENLEIKQPHP